MDKQYAGDINSLRTGESVDSTFVVSRKTIKKTKSGDDYCLICLQDRSGSIDGVIWPEALKNTQFEIGDFVKIKGDVEDNKYAEGIKKQLKITQIKKIEDKKDIEYSDFIRTTKKNIDEMIKEMESLIESMKNIYLKKLLNLFFDDEKFRNQFFNSSAAVQYHHAYIGGLLEHTLAVTKICDWLSEIYKNLNRDLVVSGAILHDIGKIKEYELDSTIKISDEGRLLGHITIGYGMVLEKINEIKGFPEDLKERLLHIILSHHGYKEFGSPKRPKILEAFVVFHIDNMDADVGGFNIILEESGGLADWSVFLKNFERSVLLRELKPLNGHHDINIESTEKSNRDNNRNKSDSTDNLEKDNTAQNELF
jgi:3'-5' exoribonuclease